MQATRGLSSILLTRRRESLAGFADRSAWLQLRNYADEGQGNSGNDDSIAGRLLRRHLPLRASSRLCLRWSICLLRRNRPHSTKRELLDRTLQCR